MKRQFSACQTPCSMYHLSSTVSQLFEPQVQKIAVFTYRIVAYLDYSQRHLTQTIVDCPVSPTNATNTGNSSCAVHLAPWAPWSNLAVRVNRAIDNRPGIQQEAICYQWFKQRLIQSQRSQIKEDTVEPSVPAR